MFKSTALQFVKAAPKVSIYVRSGASYYQPVFAANGKLRPGFAMVNGVPQHLGDGIYSLRYQIDGKRKWEPVGADAQLALTKKVQRERILAAQVVGGLVTDQAAEITKPSEATSLEAQVSEYLKETKDHKSQRTYLAYNHSLHDFFSTIPAVESLEHVRRHDIMNWIGMMKQAGLDPRTTANRVANLKTFFHHYHVTWPLGRKDKPLFTQKPASPYTPCELSLMLSHADDEERDLVLFLLGTGAREQEVMFATWRDVDFKRGVFAVTEKNDGELRWTPKDKEQGEIPLLDGLVDRLKKRRQRFPTTRLIFPSPEGKPNGHLLRKVKRLALRAGVNCGECLNDRGQSCKTHPVCERAILHRFRKSFASALSASGVDVRTIQSFLRHSSLDTTLSYLAASRIDTPEMRYKVNSAFAHLPAENRATEPMLAS